ncbi:SemiSWEET transporter [Kibdelosporangium philippinense]|uniref:SemiSWEET transporter n=1 Tax=Kibdelosporangium philippinense TaxID=211113 RepID=A0ABS8ZZ70_9PSEU|nr:SemiSWEET transporter [Kibdelosporangium philippinense]MCE7012093.1 SemiSWEET transporter [Kibdelosporangium philippinense]
MTILGLFAGALTTLAFLPQVVRCFRTRSTGDLSWAWILMMCAGVGAWFVYGLLGADMPVIVANGITLVLVAALGVIKAVHQRAAVPA